MLKPNPIIEIAVRIHAISVLSAEMIVRLRARSVRSSARAVPLSIGAFSTRLMELLFICAPSCRPGIRLRLQLTAATGLPDFLPERQRKKLHEDLIPGKQLATMINANCAQAFVDCVDAAQSSFEP